MDPNENETIQYSVATTKTQARKGRVSARAQEQRGHFGGSMELGAGSGARGVLGGGGAGPPSAMRVLKLQLFHRLQARGPRGAWTQYWTGFQRFLAARLALEEFHALAVALLGEDMRAWLFV